MNLFQLRAFDAVAREGSFTRAAERLCISQPAVTGHVKALEEHYQVTLFRRTARRIELTEEGSRLVAITRTLFALEEEAEALLDANPDFRPDDMIVTCADGQVREARICLTPELEPRACGPDVIRDACRSAEPLDMPPIP